MYYYSDKWLCYRNQMKKTLFLVVSVSIVVFGAESPKKWFTIKPYTEQSLRNDTNNSNLSQNKTYLKNNLTVFKNLLDKVDKEDSAPADPKNWFLMDD